MHARKQGKFDGHHSFLFETFFSAEAYRALELLEQYYSRLNSPEDAPLRDAIGR